MRIVAFITDAAPVRQHLTFIGKPAETPQIGSARGRPFGTKRPTRPYPTGTQRDHGIQISSPARWCSGSRIPSPGPTGDAPTLYSCRCPATHSERMRHAISRAAVLSPVAACGCPCRPRLAQPLLSTFLRCYVPCCPLLDPSRCPVGFTNPNLWPRPVCPVGAFTRMPVPHRSRLGRRVLARAAPPCLINA